MLYLNPSGRSNGSASVMLLMLLSRGSLISSLEETRVLTMVMIPSLGFAAALTPVSCFAASLLHATTPWRLCYRGSALVAMDIGFMGPNYSISTACATANYCFVAAANHIRKGDADIIIAGGSEASIIPVGLGGFVACRSANRHKLKPRHLMDMVMLSSPLKSCMLALRLWPCAARLLCLCS